MMISSTSFVSNTAGASLTLSTSPRGFGGALHLEKSRMAISNCSLLFNQAGSGGAVSVQASSILNMRNVRLGQNDAILGGAIYGLNASSVLITNATAIQNKATCGILC